MMINSRLSSERNVQEFIDSIKKSFVTNILLHEDNYPTFDKSSVPFNFLYCNEVIFITERGNFILSTIQTEEGLETFWIDSISEIKNDLKVYEVDSIVINAYVENSIYNYPFKLEFEFEKKTLTLYAAEIYDDNKKQLRYRINDEMILAFINKKDANQFEDIINYG